MSSTRGRWAARLAVRQRLLARARTLAAKREAQVAYARRVLARHQPASPRPARMFDSVEVSTIPQDAKAVAGYIGGKWPTFSDGSLERAFPHAYRLGICIAASQDGEALDCEPGDASPDQVAGWVKRQHARGVKRPIVYTSVSQMPTVLAALANAGISRSQVRLWSAHYTHTPHICGPGCGFGLRVAVDGTQFTDVSHARNLDESLLAGSWWK